MSTRRCFHRSYVHRDAGKTRRRAKAPGDILSSFGKSLQIPGDRLVGAEVDGAERDDDGAHCLLALLRVAVIQGHAHKELSHFLVRDLWEKEGRVVK